MQKMKKLVTKVVEKQSLVWKLKFFSVILVLPNITENRGNSTRWNQTKSVRVTCATKSFLIKEIWFDILKWFIRKSKHHNVINVKRDFITAHYWKFTLILHTRKSRSFSVKRVKNDFPWTQPSFSMFSQFMRKSSINVTFVKRSFLNAETSQGTWNWFMEKWKLTSRNLIMIVTHVTLVTRPFQPKRDSKGIKMSANLKTTTSVTNVTNILILEQIWKGIKEMFMTK